jgi:hypothetical protein
LDATPALATSVSWWRFFGSACALPLSFASAAYWASTTLLISVVRLVRYSPLPFLVPCSSNSTFLPVLLSIVWIAASTSVASVASVALGALVPVISSLGALPCAYSTPSVGLVGGALPFAIAASRV